jgi:hypothetical protein
MSQVTSFHPQNVTSNKFPSEKCYKLQVSIYKMLQVTSFHIQNVTSNKFPSEKCYKLQVSIYKMLQVTSYKFPYTKCYKLQVSIRKMCAFDFTFTWENVPFLRKGILSDKKDLEAKVDNDYWRPCSKPIFANHSGTWTYVVIISKTNNHLSRVLRTWIKKDSVLIEFCFSAGVEFSHKNFHSGTPSNIDCTTCEFRFLNVENSFEQFKLLGFFN